MTKNYSQTKEKVTLNTTMAHKGKRKDGEEGMRKYK
jgi:hypothetical protein